MLAAEQAEHNIGLANARVPPTWNVEGDRKYPLRAYIQDLQMWAAATDMAEGRQGPACVLRLTGAARLIMREIPADLMANGQDITDLMGQIIGHRTGLEVFVRILQQRYGALDQETQIFNVSELMTFSRKQQETTDEMFARFDVVMFRAQDGGQGVAPFLPPIRAWILLTHLKVPRQAWPVLLAPTLGMLPIDEAQYTALVAYVRRNGHLYEQSGDRMKSLQQPYFTNDAHQNTQQSQPAYHTSSWNHEPYHADYQHNQQDFQYTAYPNNPSQADDSISWHSYSTGQSEPNEELTWSDLDAVSPGEVDELLYLQYRFAKRRFRSVGFARRCFKGKGKGKGKGKHRGKGHPHSNPNSMHSFLADSPQEQESLEEYVVYFKGSKGGKGNRSGNPIGKDGKQMTCSTCGSDQHFWRNCSKGGKGSGKGNGSKGKSGGSSKSAPSFPTFPVTEGTARTPYAENQTHQRAFFAQSALALQDASVASNVANVSRTHSMISFMDGISSVMIPNATSSAAAAVFWASETPNVFYPCWSTAETPISTTTESAVPTYHNRVRLSEGEGLLVDTGARKSLTGSQWVQRQSDDAKKHGRGTVLTDLTRQISIEGVGTGANVCVQSASVPLAFADGTSGVYTAPIVPNSEIPALLGFDILEQRRVVLDCFNGKYIEVGPGGYDINLSPGSRVLELQKAATGHPMISVSAWSAVVPSKPVQVYME